MQLFKTFYKVAWKRLPAISIYLVIYAIITFLMGNSSEKNMDTNFQSKSLDICVIDEDHSKASTALVGYLDSLHNLVPLKNDPEILQDHLYYRYISYVLTIPKGFEKNLTAGKRNNLFTNVKIPGSSGGYYIDQQVNQYTQNLQLYLSGGFPLKSAITETNHSLSNISSVKTITFQTGNTPKQKEVFYFYQYLPYIFIVLLLCGMSPIIITFNQKEIRNRTHCSSMTLTDGNIQMTLSCISYSLITFGVFILLGTLIFGTAMFMENALYALLNSFTFLLVATALAFLSSNFSLDDNTTNMISNIVGLGMSFLCGIFVPQSMLSKEVLLAAKFLPAYWYVRANNMLAGFSTETFDINFYWIAIGIQLLFAIALFAIALAIIKLRQTKNGRPILS